MARWRHSFYKLVPSWLSSGDGEKVLYTLGRLTDGFIERARLSLTARFPTYSSGVGLTMLGDERGIIKGKAENESGYARRLRGWRGDRGHLVRGNPFAMLWQIWNYFGGIVCRELDTGGNVFTIDRAGIASATHGGSWNWDGDSSWFRFWLKLVPDPDQMQSWGTWAQDAARGTGTWADGANETWGQTNVTPGDAKVVADLFQGDHPWKMCGTKPEWLCVVLGGDETPTPDGTWARWTDGTTAHRPVNWRFWRLS